MKNIIKSLVVVVAVAAVASVATYAVWHSSASVTKNTFSVGNAALQISKDKSDWGSSFAGTGFFNLYPGWSNSYNIYLKNASSSAITLRVFPNVHYIEGDGELFDNIYLQFLYEDGTPVNGCSNVPLRWWYDHPDNFPIGDITQNQERGAWVAKFSIPSTAGDDIQNMTVKFDLNFNGIQI